MKRYMRKIAVALLAITLFSALATNAYASITQTEYSVQTSIDSYKTIDSRRQKQDATPLYLEIEENYMTPSYYARAMGCTYSGTTGTNLTYYNGALVDHVRCTKDAMWAIQSLIYEREYGWCYIDLKANGLASTTTGHWAPDTDTSMDYNIAPY